jgi:hypothetical protein
MTLQVFEKTSSDCLETKRACQGPIHRAVAKRSSQNFGVSWKFGDEKYWTSTFRIGERMHKVTREEIEQRFASAGWELDGSFS